MKFHLVRVSQKGKIYYSYKASYYEKGNIKSKRVYLGNEKRGLEILSDFAEKKPDKEELFSYTGEIILKEISKRIKFSNLVDKYIKMDNQWSVGDFIETLVIERCLKPYSKWALAEKHYKRSILSYKGIIPSNAFSSSNIYNYMDYFHPYIHNIQSDLVKEVYKLFPPENEVLLLDGTSFYTYGKDDPVELDEITDEMENDDDNDIVHLNTPTLESSTIKRLNGYSRDKRPDLPQINLMLGVNQQAIPLFFEVFSGNTTDLKMFALTLKRLQSTYTDLLKRMKQRYIIFDRGNLSSDNIKKIDALCEKWDIHFIGGVKSSMFKTELRTLIPGQLSTIYKNKKTTIEGKIIEKSILNTKSRKVLLYTNDDIRKEKLTKFQAKLEKVLSLLDELAVSDKLSPPLKVNEMKKILLEHKMVQLFWLKPFNTDNTPTEPEISATLLYRLRPEKLNSRLESSSQDKKKSLLTKLQKVEQFLVRIVNEEQLSDEQKSQEIQTLLRKYSLLNLFWVKKFTEHGTAISKIRPPSQLYDIYQEKVTERTELLGKFVIISSDFSLTAEDMISYYMCKNEVEHEFHLLKGVLDIRPINHQIDKRIDSHIALVNWGMLLLSVLKISLEKSMQDYSFEELLDIIKGGYVQKAIYEYPEYKNFLLLRPLNVTPVLEEILRVLTIKYQTFYIESYD